MTWESQALLSAQDVHVCMQISSVCVCVCKY